MGAFMKCVLFVLFFLSGFCGLLYQVIWLRLAFANFGVVTPLISVVVSVFMAGLFVGSWAGGGWIGRRTARPGCPALLYYAGAEAVIGIGGLLVPRLFDLGQTALLHTGETHSWSYLLLSAVVIATTLLPWCVAMGTTFPFMMAFVKERDRSNTNAFSFLYLANVMGAMCGTLLAAYVCVELFGFQNTLRIAACTNFAIAILAAALWKITPSAETAYVANEAGSARMALSTESLILFLTGFSSMALEVMWTRGFTPLLKTTIYAFAQVLATYLLATWVGSFAYRVALARGRSLSSLWLFGMASLAAFAPVLASDPRFGLNAMSVLASIVPFCAILGFLTPKLIDDGSAGDPAAAGFAYALNILGCIVGPLVAAYVLLPIFGVKVGMLLVATLLLFVSIVGAFRLGTDRVGLVALTGLGGFVLIGSFFRESYEERFPEVANRQVEIKRDHTATVVLAGEGMGKRLFVNGVGITHLTPITKMMGHLPMAFHDGPVESAYLICFGMGTTFRALHSWGIDVTAAELVPSVLDSFGFFFPDAREILADPRTHVVVDDGRRYLRRTEQKFDVVTLDPPPPIEAAASSLLHSEEFYALVKSHLRQGGILQQWFPGAPEHDTLPVMAQALRNQFPYVRVFRSLEGWGYHFLASLSPIPELTADEFVARMPEVARRDLMEWALGRAPIDYVNLTLRNKLPIEQVLNPSRPVTLTDDRPYNEYFYLRRSRN
jgi:spermidine synthase